MQTNDMMQVEDETNELGRDRLEEAERAVLCSLLSGSEPWTEQEIERELGGGPTLAADAIAGLQRCGLVNVGKRGVWASRAARAMDELEL